jgi:hypothetical protein
MHLIRPLSFLLTAVVFLGTAMAADNLPSAATTGQCRIPTVQSGSGAPSRVVLDGKTDAPFIKYMRAGQRIDPNPLADTCFTMRTYKVKPTERLRENESGSTEYSTCQMGSNYRIRSADGPTSK